MTTSIEAKQEFLNDSIAFAILNNATDVVIASYERSGRLYIVGNGRSATDAQHLAAEFVSKLARDRAPLAAEALTVDSSIIIAISNDYGFENIFSRQLCGKATKGDVFLAVTTSGPSLNILNALKKCHEMRILSIIFGGKDGGQAKCWQTALLLK